MIDKKFYPGWVRKSITFTIDDGNIPLDKKFIGIVKPNGIKGTFNLCAPKLESYTAEDYREIYDGFGISNHCAYHPFAMTENIRSREISNEAFSQETADVNMLYKSSPEGLYHYHTGKAWRRVADDEIYCRAADSSKAALEEIFGDGSINTFVWPFCEQNNEVVKDYIMNKSGYKAVRKTGAVGNSTGYALPADRKRWSYNSSSAKILDDARDYEAYPDDGELKFFCFGVHSHDFERDNCWDVLENFSYEFGNRPNEFWYASVEDIFEYEDAVNALEISENEIRNASNVKLYIKIDSKNIILEPNSVLKIK